MDKLTLKTVRNHILENKITDKDKEVVISLFFSYMEVYPTDIEYMIVFGNNNLYRIKEAVKLYNKRSCKMILSGGRLLKDGTKECDYFYRYALDHGVSSGDLICECDSNNTIENIKYSFNLIKKRDGINILMISSTQHLYRIMMMVPLISKQLEFYPNCYYYPVYPKDYTKDKWYLYENIRKDIASEIDKIIHYDLITDE